LFKAMGAKMHYLNQRERVISQNIANSDTNGYKPQDLKPVDFGRVLRKVTESKMIQVETTNSMHMPLASAIDDPRAAKQRKTYDVEPDGNAVVMEEQMIKSNQTAMDYNLMTNLYQKNMGLIRTSLGRN
jgi:flagellar basal-body rod protein FlgB